MAERPGFDLARMSTASKILVGASLLFFIDSFLPWNKFGGGDIFGVGIPSVSFNLWQGIGVLTGLLAIALLVWEGLRVAGVNIGVPARTGAIIGAALAAAVLLFTILKVIIDNEGLAFGAWIGIVLALAIGYGGYMRWQEASATAGPGPDVPPPPGGGGFTG